MSRKVHRLGQVNKPFLLISVRNVHICFIDRMLPFSCESFTHDAETRICLLSENSESSAENLLTSEFKSYHERVCVQSGEPNEWRNDLRKSARLLSDSSREERQFEDGLEALEAFERHRNQVVDTKYYAAYKSYEVGRCLDECLRDRGMCKSVIYNPRTFECRLSRGNREDARLLYDAEFDYYENLDGE